MYYKSYSKLSSADGIIALNSYNDSKYIRSATSIDRAKTHTQRDTRKNPEITKVQAKQGRL